MTVNDRAHTEAMRMQHLDVRIDAVTADEALDHLAIAVHYAALPQKVFGPFYALATRSMTKVVSDVVRSRVASLKHADIAASTPDLAARVLATLKVTTRTLGCAVVDVHVTRVVTPAAKSAGLG